MTAQTAAPILPPPITTLLRDTARRLRLRAACLGAAYGLAAGLAIGVLLGVLARVRPLFFTAQTLEWSLGALTLGIVVGALAGGLRPLSRIAVAARADADLGLRERIVTALELASGAAHSSLAEAQLRETAALVAGRRGATSPWPLLRREQIFALGLGALALVALLTLPNAQEETLRRQQANAQLIGQAAQQVAQVQNKVAARGDLDPATKQAIEQQLAQLQRDLADGTTDPAGAVARIAQTEAQLRPLQDPNAAQRGAAIPQLAQEFGTFGATAPVGERLAAGDYAGASAALKDVAANLPKLDPASQAAIAQKLREAAASQAATNPQLASQLQDAADKLTSGDVAGAQAALNNAADQIAQTGQAITTQGAVSGVLGDINAIKRDVANGVPPTTVNATPQTAQGTPGTMSGTPFASSGTPGTTSGTPGIPDGSPIAISGSPVTINSSGTPVNTNGTPVQFSPNGTPVIAQGSPPPNATPVVVQGQQGQQGGQQGNGQGQQGQGQEGQGQQEPGQQGQGQGQGQQGQSQGQGQQGQNPGGGTGSGPGGTQPYDPVDAPTSPNSPPGQPQTIPGTGDGDSPPTGTTRGAGANTPSGVPYDQVYQQYRDQALQGIDDPNIPPELREYIRQYFSTIDPNAPQPPQNGQP
jgi:hypothetical protein